VGPTRHTEPLDEDVGGGQDDIDGVHLTTLGCQLLDLFLREGFSERAVLVEYLGTQMEGDYFFRFGHGIIFIGGLPPGGDGWLGGLRRGRREGGDEIGDYGSLGRCEIAVPDDVDRGLAGNERAIVVLNKGTGLRYE
jgi:hypothetical protein